MARVRAPWPRVPIESGLHFARNLSGSAHIRIQTLLAGATRLTGLVICNMGPSRMKTVATFFAVLCIFAFAVVTRAEAPDAGAVQLAIDTSEVEAALRILHKERAKAHIDEADWRQLFETAPYQSLKAREAAIGVPFTDADFETFLLSAEAVARMEEWKETLAEMKRSDLGAVGRHVLEWLPEGATIRAHVYPEIKPRGNSFVWSKPGGEPAIFLYLARQTRDKFENTVAHECHHIGLRSLSSRQDAVRAAVAPKVATTMEWMSAFGEGEAMLAAAGSSERHPHWEDDALARARWDGDMMRFVSDLAALETFFTDILDGKLEGDEAIGRRAAPFWGDAQGAWYTVGYEMAALVEKRFGREAFLECLVDPRQLLVRYNAIAAEANAKGAKLATWSPAFLARLQ